MADVNLFAITEGDFKAVYNAVIPTDCARWDEIGASERVKIKRKARKELDAWTGSLYSFVVLQNVVVEHLQTHTPLLRGQR